MSIGRVPEVLFALLIMGALALLWLWTRTSEATAQRLWAVEGRYPTHTPFPAYIPGTAAGQPTPAGPGLRDRLRRLYPRYAWRLALLRLRLQRLQQMVGLAPEAPGGGPPLLWLGLPGLAEAVRRRAEKHAALLAFPNEIVFHLGLWLTILGTAGLLIGYVLSPVAVAPGGFLFLLTGWLTLGGLAMWPNIPGRWRHAD